MAMGFRFFVVIKASLVVIMLAHMPSALITGANRGIGRALTEAYSSKGWITFAVVRNPLFAAELNNLDPSLVVPIVADVGVDSCTEIISDVLRNYGSKLDVLINGAGVSGLSSEIVKVTSVEVNELFQIHCLGALRCTQACLPYLLNATNPIIVNITSRLASLTRTACGQFKDEQHSYAYRIAKSAQNMFTICMSLELLPKGVRVLALHPGSVRTRLGSPSAGLTPEEAAARIMFLVERIPLQQPLFVDTDGQPIEW
jgi:NAD(P)-dependent dehydrogenase (short-subunit alcohol dehydrogenase family)